MNRHLARRTAGLLDDLDRSLQDHVEGKPPVPLVEQHVTARLGGDQQSDTHHIRREGGPRLRLDYRDAIAQVRHNGHRLIARDENIFA